MRAGLQRVIHMVCAGVFLLPMPVVVCAQADGDSAMLSPADYAGIVRKYHPVVKQAEILIQKAGAELRSSRGAFDPQLKASSDQKTFDGLNYYRYWNTEVQIPTWYGIQLQGGVQQVEGSKLNPERTTGQSNYVGISVPIGKNLLIDRRRASLQQAKLFVNLSEQDKNELVNNLLMEAFSHYWTWAEAYQQYKVMVKSVAINEQRFNFVRMGLVQGDRAAIDTTEAFAQLQNFYYLRSEAYLKYQNATLELSNYLWLENNTPYQIPTTVLPDTNWNKVELKDYTLPVIDSLVSISQSSHPKLLSLDYKLRTLEIERKYKQQNLLPELNLKSTVLGSGYNLMNPSGLSSFDNNSTFGVYFSLPIRLSEARGDLQQTRLKLSETSFEQRLKKLEIATKVKQYANELTTLKEQIMLYESMLNNYTRLLRAEEGKFRTGESSLFIVNSRENKLLETNQKLLSLRGKFFKTAIALQWASGQLYQLN